MSRRVFVVVLDGLGIGPCPDQDRYGDGGSDTLANTLARSPADFSLPNLAALGLGCCSALPRVPAVGAPRAAVGTALPRSEGKDSTTGHWEMTGLLLEKPFPTFPDGFPPDLIEAFAARTGRGVLGNRAASGTAILDELGDQHRATGKWIVYTSADSVFQVAAHEEVVPIAELYRACEIARELCVGPVGVSRVIARPFVGISGKWVRTGGRKDYSLAPIGETLLDRLATAGIPRVGIGKVDDLFAGRGIESRHAPTNRLAYQLLTEALERVESGFVFANVIEFDQTWGHRNDVAGFLGGLEELDRTLPDLLGRVQADDLVIFTADHGNDPTTPSTDHSRERVPVLVVGPKVRPAALGERATFADVGQTVAEFLGTGPLAAGKSFLREVWITDPVEQAAWAVRERAYAPYSGFRVGAAVTDESGAIFAGCNVENASYGLTICAERSAVVQAVAAGVRRLDRVIVVTGTEPPAAPCGACRQVLREFGPDLVIDLVGPQSRKQWRMRDLLPDAFGPEWLP